MYVHKIHTKDQNQIVEHLLQTKTTIKLIPDSAGRGPRYLDDPDTRESSPAMTTTSKPLKFLPHKFHTGDH